MKKNLLLIALLFISQISIAQVTAAGNGYVAGRYVGFNVTNGINPLEFRTNFINRFQINGNVTSGTTAAAGALPKDGFLGINTTDPWSRLHIVNGTYSICAGYRPWMREGLLIQTENDQIWFGHRDWGVTEQQNAIINWSDDGTGPAGPDHLVFNFTESSFSNPTYITPGIVPNAGTLNGLDIMRLTNTGRVGIGSRFNNVFIPQSTLHQHQENDVSSWMQISNQYLTGAGNANVNATAVTANDGLRWGILGDNTLIRNGNAFIYNQEERHLIFSTGNNIPNNMNNTRERMRITHVGAPTNLTSGYGINNPAGIANRITRVAISHDPNNHITRPLSLLHLGYNTGANSAGGGSTDGWRPWMDIGIFTTNGTDNIYTGLKREPDVAGDRFDAVINWGDNQSDTLNFGPDHLRFIFTGTTTGAGVFPPANSTDGLEVGRFYPDRDTLGTYGRFGVGDFTVTGVNQEPTHKLDVVGNGRFRFLPDSIYMADTTVTKMVMVDENGVLRWGDRTSGFGQPCGNTTNVGALTFDTEVPMQDFNIFFTGQGAPTTNAIGLGYSCGSNMPAKFNSYQDDTSLVSVNTIAGHFLNKDIAAVVNLTFTGVAGEASGQQAPPRRITNIGGSFSAHNATRNYAVNATVLDTIALSNASAVGVNTIVYSNGVTNYGVAADVYNGKQNTGVLGAAHSLGTIAPARGGLFHSDNSTVLNYGVDAFASSFNPGRNFGVRAYAANSSLNIGVYAEVDTNQANSYAGYFVGDVVILGGLTVGSDQNMKDNIDSIADADSLINLLNPVYFDYKQNGQWERLNLPANRQMGLIGQQAETVLPNIVKTTTHPSEVDSIGNVIAPAFTYKTLEYEKIIPLLIANTKSLNKKVNDLESENQNLDSLLNALIQKNQEQDSVLNALYNLITSCCQNNNNSMLPQQNQQQNINVTNVELTNAQSIVLDQNVPNPFAEQTTINYFLPENTGRAQLLFYNSEGKLINSVELTQKGKGQLNVFANDLSTGVYTYTLIVDGKIFDTKRMVKN